MVASRNIITAVMAVLFTGGVVSADVMPLSGFDSRWQPRESCQDRPSGCCDLFLPDDVADSDSLAVGSLFSTQANLEQASDPQPVCVLTDGHDSLSLCLCALLSLGLCRSAPWVKKLSFGFIPEWYHEGAPLQIGHRVVIAPDCLCSTVACFVQAEDTRQDLTPQYRRGTIEPLWRRSQFIPTALASRGPPIFDS